jgi:glycosyltransferase involved in cell wall biosynthesis
MGKKISIILPYYNRKKLILNTLKSFEYFYQNKNIEIIIVDDMSSEEHRLENSLNFNLDIKLIRLTVKNGINPCYPYNVGVRESSGDIIILSSPETLHTSDIFEISNNFEKLNDNTYLLFSVFCLTKNNIIDSIINTENFDESVNIINSIIPKFYENLGELGYSFNNKFGSWYTHSNYRPSGLNFFTAITREKIFQMSGFDERFRFGTGYDDDEFKERLIESGTNFIYYDNAIAIHINHEVVNNSAPTTNHGIYLMSKDDKYVKNDLWGIIK